VSVISIQNVLFSADKSTNTVRPSPGDPVVNNDLHLVVPGDKIYGDMMSRFCCRCFRAIVCV